MHLTLSEIICALLICLSPYKLQEGKDFVLVTAISLMTGIVPDHSNQLTHLLNKNESNQLEKILTKRA